MKPGDFDDLPNLLELSVGVQAPPAAGIFSDLSSLRRLTMRFGNQESPDGEFLPLAPGTFEGLSSLGYLKSTATDTDNPRSKSAQGSSKGSNNSKDWTLITWNRYRMDLWLNCNNSRASKSLAWNPSQVELSTIFRI